MFTASADFVDGTGDSTHHHKLITKHLPQLLAAHIAPRIVVHLVTWLEIQVLTASGVWLGVFIVTLETVLKGFLMALLQSFISVNFLFVLASQQVNWWVQGTNVAGIVELLNALFCRSGPARSSIDFVLLTSEAFVDVYVGGMR